MTTTKQALFFLMIVPFIAKGQPLDKINAMTFNIRYANPNDGINIWENRRDWLCESIVFFDADIIGAQEVIAAQLNDMSARLPDYDHIGTGRNGGKEGEFCPIFYKKEAFQLLEGNTFWLSQTPKKVNSKSWDAALPRIVTWAKLKRKGNGKIFYFFNTHFDHKGKKARMESAKLLRQKVKEIAGNVPFLITGDLNFPPSDPTYGVLTNGEPKNLQITDAIKVAKKVYGPKYTFNGFMLEPDKDRERIDYIFCNEGITVFKHHTIDGQRGGSYISDHFPIMATFRID